MAVNRRQIASDWRAVDISGGDYTTEKPGKPFIIRVGIGGTLNLRNVITDTIITIEALDGERIEMLTDTVYATSGASNLQAIYD